MNLSILIPFSLLSRLPKYKQTQKNGNDGEGSEEEMKRKSRKTTTTTTTIHQVEYLLFTGSSKFMAIHLQKSSHFSLRTQTLCQINLMSRQFKALLFVWKILHLLCALCFLSVHLKLLLFFFFFVTPLTSLIYWWA